MSTLHKQDFSTERERAAFIDGVCLVASDDVKILVEYYRNGKYTVVLEDTDNDPCDVETEIINEVVRDIDLTPEQIICATFGSTEDIIKAAIDLDRPEDVLRKLLDTVGMEHN